MKITHGVLDPSKPKIILTGVELPNGVLITIKYNERTKELTARVLPDELQYPATPKQ